MQLDEPFDTRVNSPTVFGWKADFISVLQAYGAELITYDEARNLLEV